MRTALIYAFTLLMSFSSSAFADSYSYISECKEAGILKLRDQAGAMGIDLNESRISIDGIDDRWYNPSKYVWFKGEGTDKKGKRAFVTVMLQKNTLSSKRCGEVEGYAKSKMETDFIKECQAYAAKMLAANLKAVGATIDPKTVELDEVDARWYNPYKYAWFKAEGKLPSGERTSMTVMTQRNDVSGSSSCKEHPSEASGSGRSRSSGGSRSAN